LPQEDPKALKIYNDFNAVPVCLASRADLSGGDGSQHRCLRKSVTAQKMQEPRNQKLFLLRVPTRPLLPMNRPERLWWYWGLIGVVVIAFIVILVLNKVIATLERLLLKNKGLVLEEEEVEEKPAVDRLATLKKLAKNKKLVFFVVLCFVIGSGSWTWVTMWNTHMNQGYQPVQPIKYSHELHAGVMKIDCQYCHSGAYKSKNASIPSLNVCMNCHKVVKTESPEIHKIYDALGYDVDKGTYDSTKAKPIQWVRIHNLPDFAYFNHSQHVTVGGIKCQQCHGPIETMPEVFQYSPLTMKWCIQCHKRTQVNGKDNAYYDSILAAHNKFKKGEKVTAAVLGGLECAKCHY
jgi:hypothetical protein